MPLRVQRLKASVDLGVSSLVREAGQNLSLDFAKETQAAAAQLVLDKLLRSAQDLGRPRHRELFKFGELSSSVSEPDPDSGVF